MEFDLRHVPRRTLRSYSRAARICASSTVTTYLVAGCVGEFWTTMTYAHMPGTLKERPDIMAARGVRFGKALQMTNVLRDCGKDLRIGRSCLPQTMLEQHGLSPQDLCLPANSLRARPLMVELLRKTLDHFREALDYTLAIPAFSVRCGSHCLWPILIGARNAAASRGQLGVARSAAGLAGAAEQGVWDHRVVAAAGAVQCIGASINRAAHSGHRSAPSDAASC